jgi:type VI secretion system protein ImpB
MSASIHDKLNRVRKPRVHITYEVETEGAEVLRELPFIVGIMGDFSGDPTQALRPLADRKFIQIDRDNFNDVMAGMTPGLKMQPGDSNHQQIEMRCLSKTMSFNNPYAKYVPIRGWL